MSGLPHKINFERRTNNVKELGLDALSFAEMYGMLNQDTFYETKLL